MLRSPIDERHAALGAKFGGFAGWNMPISYPAGTLAEHDAVRSSVGVFDVSHLGKLWLRGSGARATLDASLTNRMSDLEVGRARYALLCNEDGGVIDDLIVSALDEDEWLLVPNASNRDAVADALRAMAEDASLDTGDEATIAIQGPDSKRLVESWIPQAKGLGYLEVARTGELIMSRSGYTGEWGYEVFAPRADAIDIWDEAIERARGFGGLPCGLGARDTLRLEMGYPLHGNDLSESITPIEAGLDWAVKLDGRSFPGSEALAKPPARRLVGLRGEHRVIPRAGCEVRRDGVPVGVVTSGTLSPTLRAPIALALIAAEAANVTTLDVDVRGRAGTFEVVDPPFVDRSPRRARES